MSPRATPPYIPSRQGCECIKRDGDDVFGDVREGTCLTCGHQVDGKTLPERATLSTSVDRSTFARKRRYRAAP